MIECEDIAKCLAILETAAFEILNKDDWYKNKEKRKDIKTIVRASRYLERLLREYKGGE